MSLEYDFKTIKERIGVLLFKFPELKIAHPNERLIAFWKYYDGFGDKTLVPSEITNYHSIDRGFRALMPEAYKNRKAEKKYREYFGSEKK